MTNPGCLNRDEGEWNTWVRLIRAPVPGMWGCNHGGSEDLPG